MRRRQQRGALRTRYAFRCGYCGVSETQVGAELTIDHFQPLAHGGADNPENWVYSCHACNEFKGDYWEPDSTLRILHPLQEDLSDHFREREDGVLEPLSETGAFHIWQLRLNRPALVAQRREQRSVSAILQALAAMTARLDQLERDLHDMARRIEQPRDRQAPEE